MTRDSVKTKRCGHPLDNSRWCYECELIETRDTEARSIERAKLAATPATAVPVADPVAPWHNPRADKLRTALCEIADTKNLTATPEQFCRHLQRVACRALTDDAMDEPAAPHPVQAGPLTDEQIEDCIDEANRKWNHWRSGGPRGQQITPRDDWQHWLAREVESAVRARALSAPPPDAGDLVTQPIPGVRGSGWPFQKVAPRLAVWFGEMPESNGRRNWTVILHRASSAPFAFQDGITVERTEFYDRARYEADRLRHLIGERDTKPSILDYDADITAPPAMQQEPKP